MNNRPYDFLIVGAGLFGAVFAHEMKEKGARCLVVDRRSHAGGNVYCENYQGITIHKYGAHIFHTNDEHLWNYVNGFAAFNSYIHTVLARYKDEVYNLPFNMNTYYQLWKVITPEDAINKIKEQQHTHIVARAGNLEEQALSMVGRDIYQKLIKGYTEKQWGRKACELPAFIIKRLPLRFTYDNRYFSDRYQGIPVGGYNTLISNLLKGIEVRLNVDYINHKYELDQLARTLVFTGPIDEFYDFTYGRLQYRSLQFEHAVVEKASFQGAAVVNYTDAEVPYTRIIEHKHFEEKELPFTCITKEYPKEYRPGDEPYYPINDDYNTRLFNKYKTRAMQEANVIFGGRLADYRYYDMHQVIASALVKSKSAWLKNKLQFNSNLPGNQCQ